MTEDVSTTGSRDVGDLANRAYTVAAVVLMLLGLSLFAHKIVDTDIWWHLRTGQYIIDTVSIPGADMFSYTASGNRWIDTHWLFQVILYATHYALGAYGLSLIFISIYSGVFLILWKACASRRDAFVAVLLFWLGLMACNARFLARPEAFTYLMISVYSLALLSHERGRLPGRALFVLIPLQILWTNLQGLFVLGPFLIGAYAVRPIAVALFRRVVGNESDSDQGREGLLLAGVLTGCVAACLLNPYGLEGLLFPFTLFTRVGGMENVFASSIAEFQPPFSGYNLTLPLKYFGVFLALCAAVLALDYRNMKPSHILVFAGLGYLALNARRNVAIFVLAMLPIAVEHASSLKTRLSEARDGRYAGTIARAGLWGSVALSLVIVVQVFGVVSGRYYAADRRPERFGLGFKEQTFSHGAFVFVKEKGIRGPFFNNLDAGGMFIWKMYPDEEVFIDPRLEVNDAEAFSEYRRAMSDPNAFRRLAGRYAFNAAVVSHTSQDGLGLIPILYGLPEWALVYLDPVAAVFVRNNRRNAQLIRESGIDLARDPVEPVVTNDVPNDTGALPLGRLFQKPLGADTMAQNHFDLGLVFFKTGRFDRAIEHFRAGLELTPDSVEGHYNIGIAYELDRNVEAAVEHHERAIEIDPRHVGAHTNLGRLYDSRGQKDKAEAEYRQAVRSGGKNPVALFNLGAFYHDNGDRGRARKYWQKALDANPSFGPARDALKNLDRRGL